jgi:hypothetical protein
MAQLWFEFCTVGGRIVRSGVVMALLAVVFLSFGNVTGAREKLVSFMMMGMAIPVFAAVPSLLGLRRRQGHVSLGVFAPSRALGTARLVALKVLVGFLALLVAWGARQTNDSR